MRASGLWRTPALILFHSVSQCHRTTREPALILQHVSWGMHSRHQEVRVAPGKGGQRGQPTAGVLQSSASSGQGRQHLLLCAPHGAVQRGPGTKTLRGRETDTHTAGRGGEDTHRREGGEGRRRTPTGGEEEDTHRGEGSRRTPTRGREGGEEGGREGGEEGGKEGREEGGWSPVHPASLSQQLEPRPTALTALSSCGHSSS